MTDPVSRVNVALIAKAVDALDWLTEQTGISKTDLINRAVQLYRFTEEAEANGSHLAVVRPDGTVERVRLS